MGKDIRELIEAVLKRTERIYVPEGRATWRLPIGVPSLDRCLGGGIPGGTITQIYGPEKAGKTTLAYHMVAQAVKLELPTLFVGLEGYDRLYAQACGVDVESKFFNHFSGDFAEEVFNVCIEGIRNHNLKVIVMDSITAAVPRANIEKKQPTDNLDKGPNVGAKARTTGYFVEQLQQPIRRKEAIFVAVNQLRSKIGAFSSGLAPAGGMALQYYTDVKISMWGSENKATGSVESKVTINKGKEWSVVPYSTTSLFMEHGKGIDIERDIVGVCERAGIVNKAGAWYQYGELKFQGLANFAQALREDEKLRKDLYDKALQSTVSIEIDKELKERERINENT